MSPTDHDDSATTLRDLEPPERKLVEAAAVAGRPIPTEVAAALIDASPDEAVTVGERMIERGLLRDSPGGFISTEPERTAAGLSAVRMAHLYGELARAFMMWKARVRTGNSPAIDDVNRRIYVGGEDGKLHILDLDGRELGEWPQDGALDGPITTDITLAGGMAYFGAGSQLWRYDTATGTAGECDTVSGGDFVTPVVSEGVVYAANGDGFVHLLDAESCVRTDAVFVGDNLTVKPAVHDGIVCQPGASGVSAFDTKRVPENRRIWGPAPVREGELLAPSVRSSPAVAAGLVYAAGQDGYLYALDMTSGAVVWEWYEGVAIPAAPAVTDGVVYIATTGGQVIAIGGAEGESMPVSTTTIPSTTVPVAVPGPGAG